MIGIAFGPPARFIPVASPAYLARHGTPASPFELDQHTCIRVRLPSGTAYSWQFNQSGEPIRIDVPGQLTLDRMALSLGAAGHGLGIAYVLESAARDRIAAGASVPLLAEWTVSEPGSMLYFPGRKHVPSPLRAFIAFLKSVDFEGV